MTGSPEDRVIKESTRAGEFTREVAARRLLADAGLPVAAPIAQHIGPPSSLTLPWIPGDALSDEHPAWVHEKVGALLARVNTIEMEADFSGNGSWSDWMHGWLSHALEWWASVRPETGARGTDMHTRLDALASSMDNACVRAILFDGRPEHFLISDGGQIDMIDVETLRIGDAAMDIAVLAVWLPAAAAAILNGYRSAAGTVDSLFDERVRYYTVLRTLAAAEWHRDELHDDVTSNRLLDQLSQRV